MNIVGAGAAGLSLAMMLPGSHVYEREDTPGGLCRSSFVDGFTYDQGPHILGGIPDAVRWVVESSGVEFVEGVTRNVGFWKGEYVTHPFTDHRVGKLYMSKMWKRDPSQLTLPGLQAQQGRKPGGVSSFRYPARGGYQAITDAWAHELGDRVHYGVTCEEGADVWTGPVKGGRYNSLTTVTAGFVGTAPPLTAIYLPEDWTPFHRLSFPSNFAPGNAPHGCFSVQGEASEHLAGGGDLADALNRLGIPARRLRFVEVETIRHAYPVPVASQPPTSGHGRTGGLRYLNVDGVVAASMLLAGEMRDAA